MSWRVLRVVFALVLVGASVTQSQDKSKFYKDVPRIATKPTSDNLRKLQADFFVLLKNSSVFHNSHNLTSTVNILKDPEGQVLIRSLVAALVPTIGREDSRELLHDFWKHLITAVPEDISGKLQQIDQLYGSIDSLPLALGSIIAAGDKSPIMQLLNEFFPNFKVSEIIQFVAAETAGKSFDEIIIRLLNSLVPTADKFFQDNNIDLEAEAVVQLIASLAAQFQKPSSNDNNSLAVQGEKKNGADQGNNLINVILPLISMFGGQGKKNTGGNNIIENIMTMLNKNSDGSNFMDSVVSFLSSGTSDESRGQNNIVESVMGMLNGGKNGDINNMMGMMMSLMGGMGARKKENDNVNMLATVIDMMAGGGNQNSDMAGMAKLAVNMLGQMGSKNKEKKMNTPKKTLPGMDNAKKTISKQESVSQFEDHKTANKNQK